MGPSNSKGQVPSLPLGRKRLTGGVTICGVYPRRLASRMHPFVREAKHDGGRSPRAENDRPGCPSQV